MGLVNTHWVLSYDLISQYSALPLVRSIGHRIKFECWMTNQGLGPERTPSQGVFRRFMLTLRPVVGQSYIVTDCFSMLPKWAI